MNSVEFLPLLKKNDNVMRILPIWRRVRSHLFGTRMEQLQRKAAETGLFSILFLGGIIEIIHGSCRFFFSFSLFFGALIHPCTSGDEKRSVCAENFPGAGASLFPNAHGQK